MGGGTGFLFIIVFIEMPLYYTICTFVYSSLLVYVCGIFFLYIFFSV